MKTQSAALRTHGEDARCKVSSWFDHLGNWENDAQVRRISMPLSARTPNVLYTSDYMKIFFMLDAEKYEIVIVALAKPSRFQPAGVSSE